MGNVVLLSGNGVTNSEGVTTFLGLKEGSYKIKEEVVPKGYSLLKDTIEIKIEGKKNEEGNYTGEGVLTVTKANKAVKILNDVENKDGNTLFNLQVENHAGFSLPSTGGLGNTGFIKIAIILLGIVCVLAVFGIVYNEEKENNIKKEFNIYRHSKRKLIFLGLFIILLLFILLLIFLRQKRKAKKI